MKFREFITGSGGGRLLSGILIAALLAFTVVIGLEKNVPAETPEETVPEQAVSPETIPSEAVTASVSEQGTPLSSAPEEQNEQSEPAAPESWLPPMEGETGRVMGYSYDPTFGDHRYHHGIDVMAEPGTAVKAAASGTVVVARTDGQWGGIVSISHGGGWETDYRCIEPRAGYGDEVQAGQIIGYILEEAAYEAASEAHLHFEMYQDGEEVDPLSCLP